MNQVVSIKSSLPPRLLLGLLVLLGLLTACLGGDENAALTIPPPEGALGSGSLVCSQSCSDQGQCGTTADGRTVILASSIQPSTRDHNTLLADASPVFILDQRNLIMENADGSRFNLMFFNVQPSDGGPAGWAAGSCVNQTQ